MIKVKYLIVGVALWGGEIKIAQLAAPNAPKLLLNFEVRPRVGVPIHFWLAVTTRKWIFENFLRNMEG